MKSHTQKNSYTHLSLFLNVLLLLSYLSFHFAEARPSLRDQRSVTASNCIENPSDSSCMMFTLPTNDVSSSIEKICFNRSMAVGCSIYSVCISRTPPMGQLFYCEPFSILASLCRETPSDVNCQDYNKLCSPSSVVLQCDNQSPIPNLPSTKQVNNKILSWCLLSKSNMTGCKACPTSIATAGEMMKCDLLDTYSNMCLLTGDMSKCDMWKSLCTWIPDWMYCMNMSNMNHDGMDMHDMHDMSGMTDMSHMSHMMKMWFHFSIDDMVLFDTWIPETDWQFGLTCLFVLFLAALVELLQVFRSNCEYFWEIKREKQLKEREAMDEKEKQAAFIKDLIYVEIPRALLAMIEALFSNSLMLIIMTFNAGLFISMLGGVFLGTILFGRFRKSIAIKSTHC